MTDKCLECELRKPIVGVYALTSCYGCQLMIATVDKILDIADAVDFGSFHMISSASRHGKVDIAFVEGSVSTEKDLIELQQIREDSTVLIAIGACAVNGGIQSWSEGKMDYATMYNCVYGEEKVSYEGLQAKPIDHYVKVDHYLPGCPPDAREIIYFLSTFLFGTWPERKERPVCHECRLAGNPCLIIEKGQPCLGAVTASGCGALCINFKVPCIGCRGPVPNNTASYDSLAKHFKGLGMSKRDVLDRFAMFGSHDPRMRELVDEAYGGDRA
jgi:sulfhydrogenase subunit delta